MTRPGQSDFDWVGHWFTLLNETGEASEIFFGHVPGGSSAAEHFRLPHAKFDGVTGLIDLLRASGRLEDSHLPRLPRREPPSLGVRFREVVKGLFRSPVRARQWRAHDSSWRPGVSSTETTAYSWKVFSREETRLVLQRAREAGVSANSYLFQKLVQACEPHLEESSRPSVWLVPISVHPEITRALQPRNLSSYVDVYLKQGASVQEVDRQIQALSRAQTFWGNWILLNLGRWFGEGVIRWIVRTNPRTQRKTGVFSNLGAWARDGAGVPEGEAWFFAPPVVEFQPLSSAALTWGGRMSLTIRIHPALSRDPEFSRGILETWNRLLTS